MTTTDLKQRIAEYITHVIPGDSEWAALLRSCLSRIEEQEKRIGELSLEVDALRTLRTDPAVRRVNSNMPSLVTLQDSLQRTWASGSCYVKLPELIRLCQSAMDDYYALAEQCVQLQSKLAALEKALAEMQRAWEEAMKCKERLEAERDELRVKLREAE